MDSPVVHAQSFSTAAATVRAFGENHLDLHFRKWKSDFQENLQVLDGISTSFSTHSQTPSSLSRTQAETPGTGALNTCRSGAAHSGLNSGRTSSTCVFSQMSLASVSCDPAWPGGCIWGVFLAQIGFRGGSFGKMYFRSDKIY